MIKEKMNKIPGLACIAVLMLLFIHEARGTSMPAIDNKSLIQGVVCEYSIVSSALIGIKPQQILYRLTVTIESSDNIGEGPDFLANAIGNNIQFLSKDTLSSDLFGKKIKAKARFKGDERGGVYWISDVELMEK